MNDTNRKCEGCKHCGIYMCTSSQDCVNNNLYVKRG